MTVQFRSTSKALGSFRASMDGHIFAWATDNNATISTRSRRMVSTAGVVACFPSDRRRLTELGAAAQSEREIRRRSSLLELRVFATVFSQAPMLEGDSPFYLSTMSTSSPTCGILTVSDTCFAKIKEDVSGAKLEKSVREALPNFEIIFKGIVPDDRLAITSQLNELISRKCNLVLTTGGTGFSPRDVTPEATRDVIEREAPAIIHQITSKSLEITPMAMLSRAVCGIKEQTLIVNLPGSAKGAVECFSFIKSSIPHAVAVMIGDQKIVSTDHARMQCGKSKVVVDRVADRPRQSPFPLVEVEQALEIIMKESEIRIATEVVRIEDALHRVLADDVFSSDDVPPFDASMKDGYAVRSEDGVAPRKIRSFMAAGDSPNTSPLTQNEAVRIGTGAPIPTGADAVVQVEDTSVSAQSRGEEVEINVHKQPVKGQDIRRSGCDVVKNTLILTSGGRLKSAHIGVLAAIGKSTVTVYKRASVGVFTTGNELREHYEPLQPGQIRDSNRLALINLLREHRYATDDYGIVKDEPDTIKRAIVTALLTNDVLITTGGVSMGEFDFIKRVLIDDFNATVHFGRVNVKPGKPTTFATLSYNGVKKIVFGLPGNPVSASVTCLLFVIPMLRHLENETRWQFPTIPYVLKTVKESSDPRPEYVRVVVNYVNGEIVATPNGGQISSRLNSLIGANGLMLKPGNVKSSNDYHSHIILIDDLK